ncbi:malto-oligosyltrehalose trehalohydrolase [Oscillochloris sp. ZM17-4]|uniref:malto-oligosyltrehalose trehalohydrolase n=1 Tax=Oscillochloris sp. ZM17-4 TaxID=2866714 RepID=UPI001C733B1A|nr:malto-oligosyltrehalose trehalohydrolase [Oscillochloris sp. ZM17-4]MBX0329739.1 malto-oligosyltrehalose trehalohydrolase [Oscillochloris sp. ZM17-4]
MHASPQGRLPAYDAPPGATYLGGGRTAFSVWAPLLERVEVAIIGAETRHVPMERDGWGYWRATIDDAPPGARYRYRLDGGDEWPDPASRHQPEGVHGPSAVVDPQFAWSDAGWPGVPLRDYVIYELHVGAFTPEGTFDAIIPQLPQLKELGVTAIELLPVAHFPGERNWGYDGVYLYAPHAAYGGGAGLRRLVDACHAQGVAVVLDVVYNHFGPEGNYLWAIARPFFTGHYRTPWGDAINYDGPDCDPVRHFIIANALHWLREYHIDALRLDAVHAIYDLSAYHLLEELADQAHALAAARGYPALLIAESDQNDPRLIRPVAAGGYGLDGQWADELHHAVHALLTGERLAYFAGFGDMAQLATAYRRAFVFAGEYAPNRQRRLGRPPTGCRPEQFVVCIQNHDQVGNRAVGDRLGDTLSFAQLKLAAGAMLLSPFTPMLFMGEEYAETAPFQFFTDHGDPDLVRGVREGRRAEFADFVAAHGQELPDPQDPATFARSKLDHGLRERGRHRVLRELYRELLRLRRELPALRAESLDDLEVLAVDEAARTMALARRSAGGEAWLGLNFGPAPAELRPPEGDWAPVIDSAAPPWADPDAPPEGPPGAALAPYSFRLLHRAR